VRDPEKAARCGTMVKEEQFLYYITKECEASGLSLKPTVYKLFIE